MSWCQFYYLDKCLLPMTLNSWFLADQQACLLVSPVYGAQCAGVIIAWLPVSFSNFVSLFLFLSITLPIIDSFVKLRVHFCLAYLFTSLGLRNPRFLSPAYCLSTTLYLLLRSCCQVSGILQIQDSIRRIFKAWCSRSILDLVLFLSRVITLTILGLGLKVGMTQT